jgi:chitinase
MVKQLRSHFKKDNSRDYYITAAPQCPYPDAMLGTALDEVEFDAVNVQFYNNYCSTTSSSFNFDTWDDWAKNKSPNKDVKILLGIPGSKEAAGTGYVPFKSLEPIVKDVHKKYSSFGGIMIWGKQLL